MRSLRSLWRWLMQPLVCLALAVALPAVETHTADFEVAPQILEVPAWILRGIAARESSSYYRDDGTLAYVDRRIGAAGEVGAFQMRRIAFAQVGLLSLRSEARRNPVCAEFCATLYLRWCYRTAGSWRRAIALYHTGSLGEAPDGADYYRDVSAAGRSRF